MIYPETTRNAVLNRIVDLIDAAVAPGEIRFYTAGFTTLLAVGVLPSPAFTPAVSGLSELASPVLNIPIIANGTVAVFNFVDGDGNICTGGTVGTVDADLILGNVNWFSGEMLNLNNYTMTTPEASP